MTKDLEFPLQNLIEKPHYYSDFLNYLGIDPKDFEDDYEIGIDDTSNWFLNIMNIKLIEVVNQIKNYIEIIATVKNSNNEEFLGITEFILEPNQDIPKDEDELSTFLESLNLTWDLYIPNFS